MCLSIAIHRPHDVLATGRHGDYEWVVINNGRGYRCGYVRIPAGHPWHGLDYDSIPAEVHGGLTFAEPDVPCGKGGPDDAWWIGFDANHCYDAADPSLPGYDPRWIFPGSGEAIRTQEYMESECVSLVHQAELAALIVAPSPG